MNAKYNQAIEYYRNQAEHEGYSGNMELYEKYKGFAEGYIRGLCAAGVITEAEMEEKLRYIDV